jgi:hypothetical protein
MHIRSIIDAVEVDEKAIRIIGSRDVLQAIIAGKQNANGNVRGFVRKWRATADEDGHYCFAVDDVAIRRLQRAMPRSAAIFHCAPPTFQRENLDE